MTTTFFYSLIAFSIFILSNTICLFQTPIYSILCLLLIVLIISCILISFNVFYLSLTLVIIYGGAVIVLFLFIILITYKKFIGNSKSTFLIPNNYILIIYLVANVLFGYLIDNFHKNLSSYSQKNQTELFVYLFKYESNDINIFSENLFTEYFIFLASSVFVMLLVLISAILIAKRSDSTVTDVVSPGPYVPNKLVKLNVFYAVKK